MFNLILKKFDNNLLVVILELFQMTIKGLQLLNTAILHSMSPSLALLVNDKKDSLNNNITTMLLERLSDATVEIRKSVLGVILTIIKSSKTSEYPDILSIGLAATTVTYLTYTIIPNTV